MSYQFTYNKRGIFSYPKCSINSVTRWWTLNSLIATVNKHNKIFQKDRLKNTNSHFWHLIFRTLNHCASLQSGCWTYKTYHCYFKRSISNFSDRIFLIKLFKPCLASNVILRICHIAVCISIQISANICNWRHWRFGNGNYCGAQIRMYIDMRLNHMPG
jgi:hypothetical protein